ncbi:MAG: DNA-directed RNA polymerase subunit D [Candidatus Marsarchaeota archaeon]|nr:DNA-directed RNA polymerase subunit D [Candidatus Marsarchaeota archaeon]
MKLEVIEDNGKIFRFNLKGVSPAYANALRRAAMVFVKTFAIDKITVYENTSAIFDEYIAHRIGLIPITTPPKGFKDDDVILFTLDVTGPKTVYSGELESKEREIKAANERIPIIKLAAEQHLRLEGKAVMGNAKTHAKFQPALISYNQDPKEKDSYEFIVESFGQMPAREIINKAFEVIKEELKEIQSETKKL